VSECLTYWKTCLEKESAKEPDTSSKVLLSTIVNFLVNIQKDSTQRCDTLTAHIASHAKANREAVSGLTQLVV
jgi:hypothetical protein